MNLRLQNATKYDFWGFTFPIEAYIENFISGGGGFHISDLKFQKNQKRINKKIRGKMERVSVGVNISLDLFNFFSILIQFKVTVEGAEAKGVLDPSLENVSTTSPFRAKIHHSTYKNCHRGTCFKLE